MTPMNANREVIEGMFAAYVAGDVPTLMERFHPEIVWQIVGPPQAQPFFRRVIGRDAVLDAMMSISEIYWLRSYHLAELLVDGDTAAARSIVEFLHRRTQRLVRTELVQWIRVRDGLITEFREFHDTLSSTADAYGMDLDALFLSLEPIAPLARDAGFSFPTGGRDG